LAAAQAIKRNPLDLYFFFGVLGISAYCSPPPVAACGGRMPFEAAMAPPQARNLDFM
jgi:hypothetical protein